MAYCILESSNPNFSYIIGKNPTSGPMIKELRAGHLFAWYPKDNQQAFCLFFKDSDDEVSYKDYKEQEFEYLNVSRYNSPDFPGRAIIEFFNTFLNKGDEKDVDGYVNKFTIGAFRYSGAGYFQILPKYFPDVTIETEEISNKCQKVTISTKKSLMYLLNMVSVISLLTSVKDDTEYVEVGTDRLKKLVNQITSLRPPYFMAYIFKANLMSGKKDFEMFAEQLQKSCLEEEVVLAKGSNYSQRIDWVGENLLRDGYDVLDFGCGSGTYIGRFAKNFESYYALDHDQDEIDKAKILVKRKQLEENVVFIESLEGISEDSKLQVIMSEVIEHNEEKKAQKIVKSLLNDERIHRIILTTPNKAFNQFYLMGDEEVRHHDHVNEMTSSQLEQFIGSCSKGLNYNWVAKFHGIGDRVNGEYTTFGVVMTRG